MGGIYTSPKNNRVLTDHAIFGRHRHSRNRVYPQDVTDVKRLTASGTANVFGSRAEVVPINTVPFSFGIMGFVVENVSATGTYFVQLGCNSIDAIPGPNQEIGERRFRIASTPIARATEVLVIQGSEMEANCKVWGRVKTSNATEDDCDISVVIQRHLCLTKTIPMWGVFPW